MTTINNVVNAANLTNISDSNDFTHRKVGLLAIEVPTPVGVAKFELRDYEAKCNSKETLASPPENVLVSAETNQMDLDVQKTIGQVMATTMTAMTSFILQMEAQQDLRTERRQQHELAVLKLEHELKLQMAKVLDEIEAGKHARIHEAKKGF